ncbi:MAG: MFS transporter [Chloroflexota bacterium]|nr:MFS transporter [Chloroflexota bacterium]
MKKDSMFYRFALYGFLKNLRLFEPFIILFFREGGLSFFQIGLLYSIRDLAINVLEIPTGVYADAFGRRKSMVMVFVAYIASFVIFFSFPNFYVYGLAMICFALGDALRSGTHKALILEYLKLNQMEDVKAEYYGSTRAASQLGSAANSLLAAALVFYTGNYRYIFIATIVPYVLDLFNMMSYPKELDGELVELRKGAIFAQVKATLKTFFAIFKDGDAMRVILNSSSFTAFFKGSKEYLQPILKTFALSLPILVALNDTRRSAVIIGIVYFVIYLLTSYSSKSAARFSKRFESISHAINITFLVGAGFLFVAGVASRQELVFLSIFVFLGFYVLHNLRKPLTVASISDRISNKVMASGLSVEAQVTTILMVVIAPVLGALADSFGVGTALACLGGLMLLLAMFVRVKTTA